MLARLLPAGSIAACGNEYAGERRKMNKVIGCSVSSM